MVSLQDILSQSQFSTIRSLLQKYNLLGAVGSLKNSSIFLPNNDAFDKIKSVLPTLSDDQIKNILLYHVSNSQVDNSGNKVLCTLNGGSLLASQLSVNNTVYKNNQTDSNNNNVAEISDVLLPVDFSVCKK